MSTIAMSNVTDTLWVNAPKQYQNIYRVRTFCVREFFYTFRAPVDERKYTKNYPPFCIATIVNIVQPKAAQKCK